MTTELPTNDEIVTRIEATCKRADIGETTFGRKAVNDGNLVTQLRQGREISIKTLRRINAAINEIEAEAAQLIPD